jgi:hypothetical protein
MTPVLDVLVSFAYNARADLGAIREAIGPDALLVVDSGAFTAWSLGREVTVDGYAEYLHRWAGAYSMAITLDVIGDPVATERNTQALHDQGLPVVPVFTVGAPMATLERLAQSHDLVAAGGLVRQPNSEMTKRYRRTVCARARAAGAAMHLLGVSAPDILRDALPYSCDSSTVVSAATYGAASMWDGRRLKLFRTSDRGDLIKNRDLLCGYGLDVPRMLAGGGMTGDHRARVDQVSMLSIIAFAARVRSLVEPVAVPATVAGGLPGPRVCCAITTRDIPAALSVARRLAEGDVPPLFTRLMAATAGGKVPA